MESFVENLVGVGFSNEDSDSFPLRLIKANMLELFAVGYRSKGSEWSAMAQGSSRDLKVLPPAALAEESREKGS